MGTLQEAYGKPSTHRNSELLWEHYEKPMGSLVLTGTLNCCGKPTGGLVLTGTKNHCGNLTGSYGKPSTLGNPELMWEPYGKPTGSLVLSGTQNRCGNPTGSLREA